jgi:hypothetical protein
MSAVKHPHGVLAEKIKLILPYLDERQRRLLLGAEAKIIGRRGVQIVASVSGVAERTVARGLRELDDDPDWPRERVRKPGGGRKPTIGEGSDILAELDTIIGPAGTGGAGEPLRWTTKSTRVLTKELCDRGKHISHSGVAKLLQAAGYHLPPPRHPLSETERRAAENQLAQISAQTRVGLTAGEAVIGVWATRRHAPQPSSRGRSGDAQDIETSLKWPITVCDTLTAQYAVDVIQRWWTDLGSRKQPKVKGFTIIIGGVTIECFQQFSWRRELGALENASDVAITVLHLPPVTAKWADVVHRSTGHLIVSSPGAPSAAHQIILELVNARPFLDSEAARAHAA